MTGLVQGDIIKLFLEKTIFEVDLKRYIVLPKSEDADGREGTREGYRFRDSSFIFVLNKVDNNEVKPHQKYF